MTAARQPASRRGALLAVAADLFADNGYHGTTVRGIAEAAGVLTGTLYHHFESKEAMLDVLLSHYLEDLSAAYRRIVADGTDPRTTFERLMTAAIGSLGSHRAAVMVLHNERGELGRLPRFDYLKKNDDEIRRLWIGVMEDAVSTGAFRCDVDPQLLYQVVCDVISVAVRWFRPGEGLSVAELTRQYLSILEGISTPTRA